MSKMSESHRNDMSRTRVAYRYRAINRITSRPVNGILPAIDEADLYQQLQKIDFELVRSKPLERTLSLRERIFPKRTDRRETIKLFIMLGRLTRTGVPLLNALQTVSGGADDDTLRDVLFQIERDVAEGQQLSRAMTQFPRIFPSPVLSIIAAG